MDIRPLTKEQRRFAEENHHLVFTFLNQKDLPESAFYDVVIFGYLKAVQEYCEVQALHRFKFSTLAFQRILMRWTRKSWRTSVCRCSPP